MSTFDVRSVMSLSQDWIRLIWAALQAALPALVVSVNKSATLAEVVFPTLDKGADEANAAQARVHKRKRRDFIAADGGATILVGSWERFEG